MPQHRSFLVVAVAFLLLACSGEDDPTGLSALNSLMPVSGMAQQTWPGLPLPHLLVVQATDEGGSPLSEVPVDWTVVSGGGEIQPSSSVTGQDGRAMAAWTLGAETMTQSVSATAGSVAPVEFTAEAAITGEWEPIAGLLHPVRAAAAATDGEKIYVFGGSSGAGPRTIHTQIYDPADGTWVEGADLPVALDWSTAVYDGESVHLMGGVIDDVGVTDGHWVYDVAGDSWSVGPPLPSPAAGSASALVGGEIVVAGGIVNAGSHSDHLRILDLQSRWWRVGDPVPGKLINWQGVGIGGEFFVAGGLYSSKVTSSALYRYDPASDSWASLPPMPGRNEAYAATEILGLYCVLGGREAPLMGSFSPPFDGASCYSPDMHAWLEGPTLPTAVEEAGAASVDGVLYVFGGRISFDGVIGEAYRLVPPG